MKNKLVIAVSMLSLVASAQNVSIKVDAATKPYPISPFIYGKNNSTSFRPDDPTPASRWTQLRESGVTILRENYGNEATKYHYKRKIVSAPDWYNSIGVADWDFEVKSIQDNLPGIHAMYGMPLLGWAAKSDKYNYAAWQFRVRNNNRWLNPHQNMTGSGAVADSTDVNPTDNIGPYKALKDGNIYDYLEEWPIDSAMGILDHWYGPKGIGVNKNTTVYWAMDNEPDLWGSTHDDVMKKMVTAEEFMQRYFKAAKMMRAKFPEVKLCGPIASGEWFWYQWPGGGTKVGTKTLPWVEFFIKRVAEEEKATGIKLLDVFTIHFYTGDKDPDKLVQSYRVLFDENYNYFGANGAAMANGGWDTSIKKEYILKRANDWMDQYFGPGHKKGLGITEAGAGESTPQALAVWYASMIGEFMRHKGELFTPWSWKPCMWEVLHLYGRYNKPNYLPSVSSNDTLVGVHATITNKKDSLSIAMINRSSKQSQTVSLDVSNYAIADGNYQMYMLTGLTENESFVSHTVNSLKVSNVAFVSGKASITLPPFAIATLVIKNSASSGVLAYTATSFTGTPTAFAVGSYTTAQMATKGLPNNDLSSLKVPAGYKVELFDGDNFTTSIGIYKADVADLNALGKGNLASSIKVSLISYPTSPVLESVTALSDKEIEIKWSDSNTDETGFRIERSTDGASWTIAGTLAPNATKFTDTKLKFNTLYYYRVVAINGDGEAFSMAKSATTKFGVPLVTVPGRIEAEDYDLGGNGKSYFDLTNDNKGGRYRQDSTDIQTTSDALGLYNLAWVDATEWTNYTIDVPSDGDYEIVMRISGFGGAVTLKVDGTSRLNNVSLQNSGDWNTWKNDTIGIVNLSKGLHTLQFLATKSGYNFNYFDVNEFVPESKKAYFFENTLYGGKSVFLTEGSYTTAQLLAKGIKNDDVSSVKVPSGYTVELYDGDNFTGTKYTLNSNEPDLVAKGFNDKASSIRINGTVTGQEEVNGLERSVSIYPNPNNGKFRVILPEAASSKLELYNSLGQMVYHGTHVGATDIQLEGLSKGTYILKIKSGDLTNKQKVVIE